MEILNVVSFVMALNLMFGLGVFVGLYVAHKRTLSTIEAVQATGSKLLQTVMGAIKNEQTDNGGQHDSISDSHDLLDVQREKETV